MSFALNDLSEQDVNIILSGLNELPRKASDAVFRKLEAQLLPQVQQAREQLMPAPAAPVAPVESPVENAAPQA